MRQFILFYSTGFYVENLFLVDCTELDDLLAVLEEGMRNRSNGSHAMNEHSSRSHTILTGNACWWWCCCIPSNKLIITAFLLSNCVK
jgi:hypothetical protein